MLTYAPRILPPFPNEVSSKILRYTLDAQSPCKYLFLNDKNEPLNLKLINKLANSEIERILKDERPDIMRAVVAGALLRISLHWDIKMEKPGPEKDLFIKNVKSVTEKYQHLALNTDDIFKFKRECDALSTYNCIQTILEVIADQNQNQFPIKSVELKTPITENFSNPEFIYDLGYIFDVNSLFSNLARMAQNAGGQEIRFLLNLDASRIGDNDTKNMVETLRLENVKIKKLDLSNNYFCNQGIKRLAEFIKNKPIQSLHFRNISATDLETLLEHFETEPENSASFNIGLLDISGSVVSDDAFLRLCNLIGNNIAIKHLNIRNCGINTRVKIEQLSQSIRMNTHLRKLDVLEKPIYIGDARDSFSLHNIIQEEKILKVEDKNALLKNHQTLGQIA